MSYHGKDIKIFSCNANVGKKGEKSAFMGVKKGEKSKKVCEKDNFCNEKAC